MKTAAAPQPRHCAPLPLDILTLSAIDAALGSKDRYTQEHARRVALYAVRLARRIGLSPRQAHQVGIGGLLHDIGKIGLNERIFNNKTRQLGKEMREEMQQHPHIGAALLERFGILTPVLDYVRCHHERMDGSGYPRGLKGDRIPLGARIISVADCFDAITTDRPYQKRKSCQHAFRILRQLSGNSLDSFLVETFIAEVAENGVIPDDRKDSFSLPLHAPVDDRDISG
jgi:putative nucleotidyltransferase with HDIG domain